MCIYIYIYIYGRYNNKSKLTRTEAKKLSDFKKQQIEPLRDLVLYYVAENSNNIKPNVKVKLIKDIASSKTTANINYITN